MKRLAQLTIKGYQQVLGPWLPKVCRYEPSCSQYALEALERHGLVRGGFMALTRVLRCNPFWPGGLDPVATVGKSGAGTSRTTTDGVVPRPAGLVKEGLRG